MRQLIVKAYNATTGFTERNSDKVVHFIISLILTLYIAIINVWVATGVVLVLGAVKEVYDMLYRKKEGGELYFDWQDMLADALGIIVAVVPTFFL